MWKQQIAGAIGRLCTIGLGPNTVELGGKSDSSDFVKVLDYLYRDCRFMDFVTYEAWRQAGLNQQETQELELLQQQLNAYDDPENDWAIVMDLEWKAIVAQAHKVLALPGMTGK